MLLKPHTQNCGIKFGKCMAKYDSTIAICIRLLIDLKIKRMICCDHKEKKPEKNTMIEDISNMKCERINAMWMNPSLVLSFRTRCTNFKIDNNLVWGIFEYCKVLTKIIKPWVEILGTGTKLLKS